MDLAGPFTCTPRGNRYLLVVVDYFTRWPEAIPIKSKHADVVARALVDVVFTRFGAPCELHSDQGRSFEAEVFREVLRLMGIRKTRTTSLRPQSDGAVEKLVQTVTHQLVILIDGADTEWDLQAPLVLLSLRAAPHTTTGISPAMMMFGRELNLPPSLARGRPPDTEDHPRSRHEYPAWLRGRLDRLHHEARDRAWAAALRQKERYDLRAKRPTFSVGDRVWLFNPRRRVGRCSKLQSWWDGPYVIEAILNEVVIRIQHPERPRARSKTVHADRLALVVPVPRRPNPCPAPVPKRRRKRKRGKERGDNVKEAGAVSSSVAV